MKPILIVVSPYYQDIAEQLVRGASQVISDAGLKVEIITVPGAFEIPGAIGFALRADRYSGFIALGCVIRGETSHYDIVCNETARAIQDLAVQFGAAIGFGLLTTENLEQALVRADIAQGDKGGEAAKACLRMLELQQIFLGANAAEEDDSDE